MFGHAVKVFYKDAFAKHQKLFDELGVNVNNGLSDLYDKIESLPASQREEIIRDLHACHEHRPELAMVDSAKGISNFHSPSDVIVDASMPAMIRLGGKMYGADGRTKDTKAVNPESTFSRIYQEIINFCKTNGQFDPTTMGTVPNVGLMAQKAEEYGSHDKTFEIPEDGVANIVDIDTGEVLLTQNVEEGDIWRMPIVKDAPIRDWVKLAVTRARDFRYAGGVLAGRASVRTRTSCARRSTSYLKDHDTEGLDISIMPQVRAMRYTIERVIRGQDTIAATGNILRDYLTDLFPILELGTSAKMLSIVPLMAGGGLYETGAGGSAPKHVSQLVEENHLRWDSLGEFLALGASLEDLGNKTDNERAKLLAKTLDAATGKLLDNNKNPSRKTGELDNRGSQFYLAHVLGAGAGRADRGQGTRRALRAAGQDAGRERGHHRRRTQRGAGQAGRHRRLLLPGPREDRGGDAAEQDVQRGAGGRARASRRAALCALRGFGRARRRNRRSVR